MKRSAPRPSRIVACSAKSSRRTRDAAGSPSGPIEPATKTSRPAISRASRASFTACELIRSNSSSRKSCASLRRFAPKVFVSTSSAPALMKPTWSETTASGARRFASSGQRRRGTALETSAPIPPSATIGGPLPRRSRNRFATTPHSTDGPRRRSRCRVAGLTEDSKSGRKVSEAVQSSAERVIDEAVFHSDTRTTKREGPDEAGATRKSPGGPDAAGAKRTKKASGGEAPPSKRLERSRAATPLEAFLDLCAARARRRHVLRERLERDGFAVVEDALDPEAVERLTAAVERVRRAESRNGDALHRLAFLGLDDAFLDLVDHPAVLPLVCDVLGWNVYVYHCHLDVHPPLA